MRFPWLTLFPSLGDHHHHHGHHPHQQQQQRRRPLLAASKQQGAVAPASWTSTSTTDITQSTLPCAQQKQEKHLERREEQAARVKGERGDSSSSPLVRRPPCARAPAIGVCSDISESSSLSSVSALTAETAMTTPSAERTDASSPGDGDETGLMAVWEATKAVTKGAGVGGGLTEGRLGSRSCWPAAGVLESSEMTKETKAGGKVGAGTIVAASLESIKLNRNINKTQEPPCSDSSAAEDENQEFEQDMGSAVGDRGKGVGEMMMSKALMELAGKGSEERAKRKELASWADKLDLAVSSFTPPFFCCCFFAVTRNPRALRVSCLLC